jgi:hypothetical protein
LLSISREPHPLQYTFLDLTVLELEQSDEEASHNGVLSGFGKILKDMEENGGKDGWERVVGDWNDICNDRVKMYRASEQLVVVEESGPRSRISPYALHRGMCEKNVWSGTTRVLRVTPLDVGSK